MGAFGKDDSRKIGGSFRQRNAAMQDHRRQEFTSRGGGGRRFGDNYRLNKDDFDIIRLIPGEFKFVGGNKDGTTYEVQLEYWPYWSHYFSFGKDGSEGKGTICSGGIFHFIPGKAEPCVGEMQEAAGAKNVSKSDRYAFTLVHFAPYHKIVSTDDKGVIRRSDKTGEPYYEWIRCAGRNKCDNCKDALETRPFHRLHVSLTFNQYNTLTSEYEQLIGKSCVNCRSRDSIEWKYWVCAGCGEIIFERGVTDMDDTEVRKETLKTIRCPTCKNDDYLDEVVECSKCGDPRRATIFDVNLHLKGTPSARKGLNLLVGNWSEPCPLDPAIPEDLRKPMDLPRLYTPETLQRQADVARIKLEPGQGAMSQKVEPYGGETPNYGK